MADSRGSSNKAREKFCPKCGEDITDSYDYDPDPEWAGGGWYCDACELWVEDDGQ